tara:strand:+ start:4691 stop:6301 length:1611 start_codon:yes stop_codon:yes gene_type:complete
MPPINKQRQVREIVKCGKDPAYFFNKYVKIQHPTRGLIPFNTYTFQDDCVKDFVSHRFNIILKSRQLGISTLTAAYAVWLTLFYKDKNILIIATKLAVAQNFIKKVKVALKNIPAWLVLPELVSNNKQSVEFSNGSSIKAIPTSDDAGRSEALSLLIVDEAAFVRNFDELWMGLYPTVSTGGRAIILSTPNGVGGQYHDLWIKAETRENEFNPIKLLWDVHPERDNEWFEDECKNLTQKQIAQELLCDFAASGDTFLSEAEIEKVRLTTKTPLEKWGPDMGVWMWKYPLTEHQYIISADIARGDAADYSTFHVIDANESEIAAEYKGKLPPDQFAVLLNEAGMRYNKALVCPENNTYGYAVVMKLKELGYPNLYYKKQKDKYAAMYSGESDLHKIGFTTSAQSRAQILTKLEEVIRNGQIRIYSTRLYEELKTFIWKGSKAQAQKGKNDDLVMALAIGVWLYDTDPSYHKQNVDVNAAMLNAFAINKNDDRDTGKNPWDNLGAMHDPLKPILLPTLEHVSGSTEHGHYGDMSWLLK